MDVKQEEDRGPKLSERMAELGDGGSRSASRTSLRIRKHPPTGIRTAWFESLFEKSPEPLRHNYEEEPYQYGGEHPPGWRGFDVAPRQIYPNGRHGPNEEPYQEWRGYDEVVDDYSSSRSPLDPFGYNPPILHSTPRRPYTLPHPSSYAPTAPYDSQSRADAWEDSGSPEEGYFRPPPTVSGGYWSHVSSPAYSLYPQDSVSQYPSRQMTPPREVRPPHRVRFQPSVNQYFSPQQTELSFHDGSLVHQPLKEPFLPPRDPRTGKRHLEWDAGEETIRHQEYPCKRFHQDHDNDGDTSDYLERYEDRYRSSTWSRQSQSYEPEEYDDPRDAPHERLTTQNHATEDMEFYDINDIRRPSDGYHDARYQNRLADISPHEESEKSDWQDLVHHVPSGRVNYRQQEPHSQVSCRRRDQDTHGDYLNAVQNQYKSPSSTRYEDGVEEVLAPEWQVRPPANHGPSDTSSKTRGSQGLERQPEWEVPSRATFDHIETDIKSRVHHVGTKGEGTQWVRRLELAAEKVLRVEEPKRSSQDSAWGRASDLGVNGAAGRDDQEMLHQNTSSYHPSTSPPSAPASRPSPRLTRSKARQGTFNQANEDGVHSRKATRHQRSSAQLDSDRPASEASQQDSIDMVDLQSAGDAPLQDRMNLSTPDTATTMSPGLLLESKTRRPLRPLPPPPPPRPPSRQPRPQTPEPSQSQEEIDMSSDTDPEDDEEAPQAEARPRRGMRRFEVDTQLPTVFEEEEGGEREDPEFFDRRGGGELDFTIWRDIRVGWVGAVG
ncbi:hypothetical protein P7C73_g2460, partial [Tremellales sp. Uapishka_1]